VTVGAATDVSGYSAFKYAANDVRNAGLKTRDVNWSVVVCGAVIVHTTSSWLLLLGLLPLLLPLSKRCRREDSTVTLVSTTVEPAGKTAKRPLTKEVRNAVESATPVTSWEKRSVAGDPLGGGDVGARVGTAVGTSVGAGVGAKVGRDGRWLGCVLGCPDGRANGCAVGCESGCVDGCVLGCVDGCPDGFDGRLLGCVLGWAEGRVLGCELGLADGCVDGWLLGCVLGCVLGCKEGCVDGCAVGCVLGCLDG